MVVKCLTFPLHRYVRISMPGSAEWPSGPLNIYISIFKFSQDASPSGPFGPSPGALMACPPGLLGYPGPLYCLPGPQYCLSWPPGLLQMFPRALQVPPQAASTLQFCSPLRHFSHFLNNCFFGCPNALDCLLAGILVLLSAC